MNNLPISISILFVVTTLVTIWQFYKAANSSKKVLVYLLAWTLAQGLIGLTGFYKVTQTLPPRFVLLIGPAIIFITILFVTKKGRVFIDALNIRKLTLLHSVRIPVEITLYFIYAAGFIPVLMTFEGNNYDIISGITAPIIFYLVFIFKKLGNKALLVWNFLCLGLLFNIIVIAILSAQTPFQVLAFEQPNIGVTYFPFVWLPSVVVPIVLLSHLAAIRQLLRSIKTKNNLQ